MSSLGKAAPTCSTWAVRARTGWLSLEPLWWDFPVRFTVVNLDAEPSDYERMEIRPGNACSMPEFTDNMFDIVHSNSVIEHVGQWAQTKAMAGEVRRLAPVYFVQTPNLWFPIEPHYKLPFIHWLPPQLQAHALLARKKRYLPAGSTYAEAYDLTERVQLLSKRQMRLLFPDARLIGESFAGFTKSWIALKNLPSLTS